MAETGESQKPRGRPSRAYLVGMLRVALRPSRISLVEVRRLLRVASALGYDPVAMYQEAASSRPEVYDPPPLLASVLPRDLPRESRLDLSLGKVLTRRSPSSRDLKAVGRGEETQPKKR